MDDVRKLRRAGAVAAVVATLVLSGCGGGGGGGDDQAGDDDGTTTTGAPVTTEGSTISTLVPEDPATTDLARAALLDPADLGTGWLVDQEPKPGEVQGDDCAIRPGGPLETLPSGAYQQGAQVHYDGARWYIGSSAIAFPDEAGAQAWVDIRRSPEWVECRRGQFEEQQRNGNPDLRVRVDSTTNQGLGESGFEAYTRFQLQVDEDGEVRDANGTFDRYVYRVGRVVLLIGVESVSAETDPPDLNEKVGDGLTAAVAQAYARVGAGA